MDTNPNLSRTSLSSPLGRGKSIESAGPKIRVFLVLAVWLCRRRRAKPLRWNQKEGLQLGRPICSCGCSSGVRGIIEAIPLGDVGNVGASCVGHGHVADI
jgi:hypothetical protein